MIAAENKPSGKYHPYPEYKDSGVEWLGNIPSHWTLKKLKYLCTIQTGSKDTVNAEEDGAYPFFVRSQTVEKISTFTADCEAVLTAGDGVGVGKVYHYYNGKFDYHQRVYMLSDFKDVTGRFVYYYLSSNFYKVALEGNAKSTVDSLRLPQFLNFEFSVPSFSIQNTIVAFLDYETARIDRLIAKQQQLIELLKEKRQAVISHAVTKGLNPDVPMKDSGVEWLGQVPEHWQCVPFGLLVSRADLGGNYLGGQEENGIPFLKMGNLGRGCIVLDKLECLEEGSSFEKSHRLNMGDFLFNTRNSLDLVGKVAVWHDELDFALYNSNILRVRFKNGFVSNPDFMGFVFNSSGALGWLALLAKGTTSVAAIYYKDLRSMMVPIPPVDDQHAISSYIPKCLSRLDTLEKKAIQSIDLMNERRTALISAAVTGKIDLRGWTPPAEEVAA